MAFDFHVHGLWILGSVTLFLGALIAGNLEWVEGTTELSFLISVILAIALFMISGLLWISSAINAKEEV
jgi:hypothetical protein